VGKLLHESSAPFLERFGGLHVLDDVTGHWSADLHVHEKVEFVQLLQVGSGGGARDFLWKGACPKGKMFKSKARTNLHWATGWLE